MKSTRPWNAPDGDAMLMEGVADSSYDFVHSSYFLGRLLDPVRHLQAGRPPGRRRPGRGSVRTGRLAVRLQPGPQMDLHDP
jgi:hypothetical protein